MVTNFGSSYIHTAWATDGNGANFNVSEFDGATWVGTLTDANSAENTDYTAYTWIAMGETVEDDEVDETDVEETAETNDETDDSDVEPTDDTAATVTPAATPTGDDSGTDDITDATADGVARLEMAVGLQADSTTTQITNANLISGTNNGAAGWVVSSGFTAAGLTDTVYTDTAINCARITNGNSAAVTGAYAFFASDDLAAAVDAQTQDYTLSFDMRASTAFVAGVKVCDTTGSNTLVTYDDADYVTDDGDYNGVWVHYVSTAVSNGGSAASQGVYIDLSNMPAGATLDVANLKVETGAENTPWKMSAKEAGETANAAKTTAETAQTAADSAATAAASAGETASAAKSTADSAATAAASAGATASAAKSTAETAQTTAENAATAAADAAKTASNYITDETNGIFVHPESNTTDGVKITSSVDIVKSGVVLASYGDGVTLGDSTQAGYMQIKNGQIAIRFNNSALNESGWIEFGTGDSTNTNVLNIWANVGSVISTILNLDLDGNATFGGNVESAGNILSSGNITAGGAVSANNFKCGTIVITPTAAGTVTSETIYFDKSFDTAPVVVCNAVSTRPDKCTCAPSSVTADSFILNFYRDTKTATRINWFAFATS